MKKKKTLPLPYLPHFHLHASITLSHKPSITPSHTHWPTSTHICRQPPLPLHMSASSSLMVWFFSFISLSSLFFLCLWYISWEYYLVCWGLFFCNISFKFLCFTLHITTPHMGTLHFFWVFLLPFQTDQNRNKTETDWFPIILVGFGWEFQNPNFQFRLAKHKENRPN